MNRYNEKDRTGLNFSGTNVTHENMKNVLSTIKSQQIRIPLEKKAKMLFEREWMISNRRKNSVKWRSNAIGFQ